MTVTATVTASSSDATINFDLAKGRLTSSGTVTLKFNLTLTVARSWAYDKTYRYLIAHFGPVGLWATAAIEFDVTLNGKLTFTFEQPATWNLCFDGASECHRGATKFTAGARKNPGWDASLAVSGTALLRLGLELEKGSIVTTDISVTATLTLTATLGYVRDITVGIKVQYHVKVTGIDSWIDIANIAGTLWQKLGTGYCHKGFGDITIADIKNGTIYNNPDLFRRRRR